MADIKTVYEAKLYGAGEVMENASVFSYWTLMFTANSDSEAISKAVMLSQVIECAHSIEVTRCVGVTPTRSIYRS